MNTAKAEIVNQPVVRLTIELSNTHAAELGGLLAYHVDWEDFPWAESIYDALVYADIRGEAVFWDEQFGRDVLLRRKQSSANGRRGTSRGRTRNDERSASTRDSPTGDSSDG